jgi:arylsulfatase
MEADRTEMHNIAGQHPDRVQAMIQQYTAWAKRCGVIPREKILELMKAGGTAFWEEERQP